MVACIIGIKRRKFDSALSEGLYFILERFSYLLKDDNAKGFLFCDQLPNRKGKYITEINKLVLEGEDYRGKKFRERQRKRFQIISDLKLSLNGLF